MNESHQHQRPLLVSDFCQRSKHQLPIGHRRRRRQKKDCYTYATGSSYNLNSSCNNYDPTSNDVQVNVNILRSIPFLQNISPNSDQASKNEYINKDIFATVYTRDIQLLHELQIFNGQICFLVNQQPCQSLVSGEDENYNYHTFKTPVILKVIPMDYQLVSILPATDENNIDNVVNNGNEMKPSKQTIKYQIYVPPTIAGSIGIHAFTLTSSSSNGRSTARSPSSRIFLSPRIIPNHTYISHATTAKIIEIGKHPIDYVITFDDIYNFGLKEKQQQCYDTAIKEYFYDFYDRKERNNQKIEASRLVGLGSIFATLSSSSLPSSISNDDNNRMVRFYRVIHLESGNEKDEIYTHWNNSYHDKVCWLSPKTKLTLVHNMMNDSRNVTNMTTLDDATMYRLPQPSLVKTFLTSIRLYHDNKLDDIAVLVDNETKRNYSKCLLLDDLSKDILSLSSDPPCNHYGSQRMLASHMLHVIRKGEKQLKQSLDFTADKLGMNIIHIDGLAAFSFRQHQYSCKNKNFDRSKSITGSIPDKLAGLKLAFEIAYKCSPCLLHINNFDKELFDHEDEEIRDDEENRLMSIMKEQLLMYSAQAKKRVVNDVPHIFIIISTSKILRHGPFSSSLIYDSVQVKSSEMDESNTEVLEATKASSLIPDVRWEDVGGLSHVREEIIDTIELPLKHPHLFGKSKRSGILLYGPPGTGKTLIAKAIATECNIPFISVKGPELLGSYVGESEGNIRSIFDSARREALNGNGNHHGAILFFDEIDSLAPRRGFVGQGGGVMERVVATFLGEMDKELSPSKAKHETHLLFVIAATNRPDLLDPSLLRPGRFDRLIYLGVTKHRRERISILTSLIRKFEFEDGMDASTIASKVIDHLPESLTGADFAAVCHGALMLAVKRLCCEADKELESNQKNNTNQMHNVEEVISGWDMKKRVPKVKADDFVMASTNVVPLITKEDLKKFEELREKFQT